jgi:O-6-methylguanine DNA methyltransferase
MKTVCEPTLSQAQLVWQPLTTPMGEFVACWSEAGLRSFEFRRGSSGQTRDWPTASALTEDGCLLIGDSMRQLELQQAVDYFVTGFLHWDLDRLDWQGISHFHRQVLLSCAQIPPGETQTYGKLAATVGSPRAARAVGGAMASNRWPLIIPCHRVVGSTGKLTGYSGEGGVQTKQKLLDMERKLCKST